MYLGIVLSMSSNTSAAFNSRSLASRISSISRDSQCPSTAKVVVGIWVPPFSETMGGSDETTLELF